MPNGHSGSSGASSAERNTRRDRRPAPDDELPAPPAPKPEEAEASRRERRRRHKKSRDKDSRPPRGRSGKPDERPAAAASSGRAKDARPAPVTPPRDRRKGKGAGRQASSSEDRSFGHGDPSPQPGAASSGPKASGAPPPPEAVSAEERAHAARMQQLDDLSEDELATRVQSLSGVWDNCLDIDGLRAGDGVTVRWVNKRGAILLLKLWDDHHLKERIHVPSEEADEQEGVVPQPPPNSSKRAASRSPRRRRRSRSRAAMKGSARPSRPSSSSPARPTSALGAASSAQSWARASRHPAIEEGLARALPVPPHLDEASQRQEEEDYQTWLATLEQWRSHQVIEEDLLRQALHCPRWWTRSLRAAFTHAASSMAAQMEGKTLAWPELVDGDFAVPLSEKQVALGSLLFREYDSLSPAQRGLLRTLWSDALRNTKSGGDWAGFGPDPTLSADLELAQESPTVRGRGSELAVRRPPEPKYPPPRALLHGAAPLPPRFMPRGGLRAPIGTRALGNAVAAADVIPAWRGDSSAKGKGKPRPLQPSSKRRPGKDAAASKDAGASSSAAEAAERPKKRTRRAGKGLTAKRHRAKERAAEEAEKRGADREDPEEEEDDGHETTDLD